MPRTDDRVTDAKLQEIHQRLLVPLNEEGLRAWYPADVSLLMREVLAQRGIMAAALDACRDNPALEDDTIDLVAACTAIRDKWDSVKTGVWAKAEVKRLRESLAGAEADLAQYSTVIAAQQAHVSQLEAQVADLQARIVDTISDAKAAAMQREGEHAKRAAKAEALVAQAVAALRD
jgi:hypothetical protein